jgi:hypothetical protein
MHNSQDQLHMESIPPIKHTHPPVFGLISDCPYCQKHGNVFHNGPIKTNLAKLDKHMHCFYDDESFKK